MWSLACVFIVVFGIFRAWVRSRLTWRDFLVLRGAFLYTRIMHRWSANRRAPFPRHGPAIVISNHTCSADGSFLLAGSDRILSFLVAYEHYYLHPRVNAILKGLGCVPVVRTGPDPTALRQSLRRLAEGRLVSVFPEGNLSGVIKNRGRVPKPGMAFLALVSRLPVYPVYIAGGPHTDQLLDSWVLPTRRAVRVVFGNPIDLAAYHDRPRTRQVIDEVNRLLMRKIYELNPRKRKEPAFTSSIPPATG